MDPRARTLDNFPAAPRRQYRPLEIGPRLRIWPPVVLAPMVGVTSYPYRKICRDAGAGLCITEMLSARALVEGHSKTLELAEFGPEESPRSVQIFGSDPETVAAAARMMRERADHIDLNFGCPAPKIIGRGAGASIPADPELCRRVVRAAVRAADPVPVSVKVRIGLDEERTTFRDAARIAEGEGCAYIALHARTVAQGYSGRARWDAIRELKESVRIPVLGNGDIFRAEDAFRMMEATGCDGVIIGRGCLGNPWLFSDLKQKFDGAGGSTAPSLEELAAMIRLHYRLLQEHFADPRAADSLIKKFGTWYARGIRGAAAIRRQFQAIRGAGDLERVLEQIVGSGWQEGFRPFSTEAFSPEGGSVLAETCGGPSCEPAASAG